MSLAIPNVYKSNNVLVQIYKYFVNKHFGVISTISVLYSEDLTKVALTTEELYSLLTVLTHIIVRYVNEKEEERDKQNLPHCKHILPLELLNYWEYAYNKLKADSDIDLDGWLQIFWLNNFSLDKRVMSYDSIYIILQTDEKSELNQIEQDFIKKIIYLEASAKNNSDSVIEKRNLWKNSMDVQLYEKLVIMPYRLFYSGVNFRNNPRIEKILNNLDILPRLPELREIFESLDKQESYPDLEDNEIIPISV